MCADLGVLLHHGFTVWLTGLPASGKRRLAEALARQLRVLGLSVEVIDSGKLRRTPLGSSVGFSVAERDLNARRHALAARMLTRNGVVAVVSAVSPLRSTRDLIRTELGDFFEVHVSTPPAVCAQHDPTGNWAKALAGEIQDFTGVNAPFEAPLDPEATVDMSVLSPEDAAEQLVRRMFALELLENRPGSHEEDGPFLSHQMEVVDLEE